LAALVVVSSSSLEFSSPDAALSESSVVDSELPVLEVTVELEVLSESELLSSEEEMRSVETEESVMGESVS
jgi:hypothetical protein